MILHSLGISLPCCTSSGPLALVVCGICLVACDTLLCAAQRGNVFPSCFCFFVLIIANLSRFCDKSNHPSYFFAQRTAFCRIFPYNCRKSFPCPMPHRSPVPNSSPCIPRSDAAASGPGRNAQPDAPSHGEKKNAARCDDECSALRWRMQCTAWAHAPHCVFGGISAGL